MCAVVRWHGPAALALLAAGIALIAVAVAQGGAQVHLVVIVPVVTGTSPVAFGGVLLIMAALVLGFVAVANRQAPASPEEVAPPKPSPSSPSVSTGGVVFIGPFPVVFGSNPRLARTMLLLAVIVAVVLVAFYLALASGVLVLR